MVRWLPASRGGKRRLWLLVLIFAAGAALLRWPQASAGGVSRGLSVCGNVLIPSLFPFLVLSGFLIRCGVAAAVGRRLERPTRLLFGLPGCCAAGILLAFVGGYPTGAAAAAQLRRRGEITAEEGRRMLRFCVAGGPGFVISAVGVGMTGYAELGAVLFAAQVLSALLIGMTGAPPAARKVSPPAKKGGAVPLSPAVALVESVTAACETLLSACGFVLLFSALLSVLDAAGVSALLHGRVQAALLPCLLEVSCGCVAAAAVGAAAPFLLGFAVCFGGLSVHCQIASVVRGTDLMTPAFFLSRLAHGVLGGLLTLLLLRFVPLPLMVFGNHTAPLTQVFSGSAVLSAALMLLCGVWILVIGNRKSDRVLDFSHRV